MKKHEMVLDFTSLLDVILIILFLVLCTMNGKAEKDAATIDELTEQNEAYAELTQKQEDELNALTTENADISEQLAALQKEQEELQAKYEDLKEQNTANEKLAQTAQANLEKFMEIAGLGKGDTTLFQLFGEITLRLELKLSVSNPNATRLDDCKLTLYYNGNSIGTPLIFNPGDVSNWEQLLPKNIPVIKKWLTAYLEDLGAGSDYNLVLIALSEDEIVKYKSLDVVKKALESLDMDRTKGYDLYYKDNAEN